MTTKRDIAIIGGGAVGPLLLAYISNEIQTQSTSLRGVKFHLIDPQGFGNGGVAYGQCHPDHVLNSVIQEMAPCRDGAFLEFLEKENIQADQQKFYSRSLYKKFIQSDLVWRSVSILKSHGALFEEHKRAALIEQNPDGGFDVLDIHRNLISPDLTSLSGRDIILTVGYGPNDKFLSLKDKAGFIQNIYDKDQKPLSEREPRLRDNKARVAVIGSGPGLYDVVNELEEPFEQFLVFSGAGKGLNIRDLSLEENERSIPPHRLLSLDKNSTCADAASALQAEFTLAAQGRSARRIALDIQKNIKEVLQRLDGKVAIAFRQSAEYAPIKHIATPVPEHSKLKLEQFNPVFVKARLRDDQITKQDNGVFKITVDDKAYFADIIINATGHGRHNSPIIKHLKQSGLARVSEVTNSLETDETDYRVLPSGLSVIGPATHVGTDGMESFACYAERYAKTLVSQLNNQSLENSRDFVPQVHYASGNSNSPG